MVINEVIEEEDEDKKKKSDSNLVNKINNEKNNNDSFLEEKLSEQINNIKVYNGNEEIKDENSNSNFYKNSNKLSSAFNAHNNILLGNKINMKSNLNNNKNNKFTISAGKWNHPSNYPINSKENIITHKNNFNKYTFLRDKVLSDNNTNNINNNSNKITLPELNKNNNNNNNNEINSNNKNENIKPIKLSHTVGKNTPSNCNNLINETPSTSAFTNSTKKYINNKHNLTEEVSKFRMGLLSAGSSLNANNNIIIPMLPLKRPVSNFNFGGGQLWENMDKNITNINNINNINNMKSVGESQQISGESLKNSVNSLWKLPTRNKNFKSQDMKGKFNFSAGDSNNNNIFAAEKMTPKLHKIKIEKGMMNAKLANVINKQMIDCQKYLDQSKTNQFPYMMSNSKFRSHSYKRGNY